MATVTVRNGIDVDQLVATIGAIESQPSIGSFTFKAGTTWENGTINRGEIGDFIHNGEVAERPEPFHLTGDEPPVLLGSNGGPNAVELLLAALGFCYGVGYVANAAARGIEISELRYEVTGDIDVQNFLGMTKSMRPGSAPFVPGPGCDRRTRRPSSSTSYASTCRTLRQSVMCWPTRSRSRPRWRYCPSRSGYAAWSQAPGSDRPGAPASGVGYDVRPAGRHTRHDDLAGAVSPSALLGPQCEAQAPGKVHTLV